MIERHRHLDLDHSLDTPGGPSFAKPAKLGLWMKHTTAPASQVLTRGAQGKRGRFYGQTMPVNPMFPGYFKE